MAPVKKRDRKEYADTVRYRLKKLADSVQEIRSELPEQAGVTVPVPVTVNPGASSEKRQGGRFIWITGILLVLILSYLFFRKWKSKG